MPYKYIEKTNEKGEYTDVSVYLWPMYILCFAYILLNTHIFIMHLYYIFNIK